MPQCFSLTRKSEPDKGPVSLSAIDEEMCKHFNHPCHPTRYMHDWFNIIGFKLAVGRSFQSQREQIGYELAFQHFLGIKDQEAADLCDDLKIIDWLDQNFVSDAWYSPYK